MSIEVLDLNEDELTQIVGADSDPSQSDGDQYPEITNEPPP